jgi:hypothetical protein
MKKNNSKSENYIVESSGDILVTRGKTLARKFFLIPLGFLFDFSVEIFNRTDAHVWKLFNLEFSIHINFFLQYQLLTPRGKR